MSKDRLLARIGQDRVEDAGRQAGRMKIAYAYAVFLWIDLDQLVLHERVEGHILKIGDALWLLE